MKYTEKLIQEALYKEYNGRSHKYIVPNSRLFPSSEADLLSVTTSGFINEFEIKITRQDWKEDYKKKKFSLYKTNYIEKCRSKYILKNGWRIPNYFWYVVPKDLYEKSEDIILTLPDYCGILAMVDWGYPRQIKKAKILHRQKINDAQKAKLSNSLSYRYWNMRLKK